MENNLDCTKIVVVVEGGLVRTVLSNKDVDVLICDYDVDGTPEHELTFNPYGDSAFMHTLDCETSPETVDSFFRCFWDGGK